MPAFKPELSHRLPNGRDHFRGSIVGVRCGRAGRSIFFRAEQLAKFARYASPFAGRVRLEQAWESAPAGVLHENRLFVCGSLAASGFNVS